MTKGSERRGKLCDMTNIKERPEKIEGRLLERYGIEISADLISTVTDAVLDKIATWHARPLESLYPPVFSDSLGVKIRNLGLVRNKAVHIPLSVREDGTKRILGL